MSPSSGKRKKSNTLYFMTKWTIALLFTFKMDVVLSLMAVYNTDNMATLLQNSVLSGKLLPGKEFRVLAINFPPFFTYKKLKEGDYIFGGMAKNDVEIIAEYFNMSIKYILVDPADIIKYGLNAVRDPYLDNKLVDFVPLPRAQNIDSMKHMELITPIAMEHSVLLQPYPKEESHLYVIVMPFELPVWLCFLVTTAVFVLVSAIIIKNKANNMNFQNSSQQSLRQTIYNQLDFVFRLFTNQGTSGTHARTRTSFKIMTGIWLLSIVVLINAYSGVLTSLLTVTKLKPIAQTLKDVAENKELQVTCEKNSDFATRFLNAKEGFDKILGDQLRNKPTLVAPDPIGILNNVIQNRAAYPGPETLVKYMINEDKKKNGHCRMTFSTELRAYSAVAWQFQFPIGSPYAATYSKFLLLCWDSGLVTHSRSENFQTKDLCRVDKQMEAKKRALTLNDLSPAFVILGFGFSLSTFCFVIEILSNYVLIWATGRVNNMDTEKPLQTSCESRPGKGRVETGTSTPPTAHTLQCKELEEETEDGVAQWIEVPIADTDGMQGEGAHPNPVPANSEWIFF